MSKLIVGASSFAPISYLGLFVLKRLKIYEVDSEYIRYLSKFQEHLFFSDGDKSNRKYIGIILEINGYKYFAPLSSFKNNI